MTTNDECAQALVKALREHAEMHQTFSLLLSALEGTYMTPDDHCSEMLEAARTLIDQQKEESK